MTDCIDLRTWAKAKRYRWRFEESYEAEKPEHRGDGRWYVEIVCQRGLIYPVGGLNCAAYTESVHAWGELLRVEGISRPQEADGEWRCRFPLTSLDAVATILRPKRLSGVAQLTDEHRARLKPYAFQGRKTAQYQTIGVPEDSGQGSSPIISKGKG
jgi:hypothetical protein